MMGSTVDEYMLSGEISLFPLLKALYQQGTLTIGDLVRYQPSLFLP